MVCPGDSITHANGFPEGSHRYAEAVCETLEETVAHAAKVAK
jgi:hypothetical protein